jgi:hypothetical protein
MPSLSPLRLAAALSQVHIQIIAQAGSCQVFFLIIFACVMAVTILLHRADFIGDIFDGFAQ